MLDYLDYESISYSLARACRHVYIRRFNTFNTHTMIKDDILNSTKHSLLFLLHDIDHLNSLSSEDRRIVHVKPTKPQDLALKESLR